LFGTLENPQLDGQARLDGLAVNQLLFEPLVGPVAFSLADGGRIDLRGQTDRLQLVAAESAQAPLPFWPKSFEVRNQDFVANGYGEGSQIHADVVQLPLERLDLQPALKYGFGRVGGLLEASVDVDLANFSNPVAEGTLSITQPTLSPVDAEQLTASFAYANNTATLKQGELLFDDSRYLLTGSANLASDIGSDIGSGIQYEGALTIAEGRIEDLVPIIEKIDLSAFGVGVPPTLLGSAADLATVPAGVPQAATLLGKLESFVAFLEAHPEVDSEPSERVLASLEELTGEFSGVVEVAGSSLALADATADFDIQGDSWQWGADTPPNEFALRGEVEQMSLDIDTAFINAGETEIALSGGGNLNQLNGELTINNLPVELAELIYPLPARVEGDLNLVTTFGGSLANPIVDGEAVVVDTQVNGYSLEQVEADFNYRNAIFNLESEVAVSLTDSPITIEGRVPYALAFMTVQPTTEQIAINAVVPNDNFEVINALTDGQVLWQSGQGEVLTQVSGTLAQPVVAGRASFREGAISSPLLRDPLTSINGEVRFNLEQVDIQQLRATVGEGSIAVAGGLPLLPSGESILGEAFQLSQVKQVQPPQTIPADLPTNIDQNNGGLVVALENLPVDYSDLLRATIEGRVLVMGAVLAPTISGAVEIDDGRIEANRLLAQAGSLNLPTTAEVEEISPYRAEYLEIDPLAPQPKEKTPGILERVTLQNFALAFGDRLTITGQPFYNITALGDITVNGPLSDLQPAGTIALKSGWINLFSTQFRLDRNAPNTATFTPENGLDPVVDVVMRARVQEADVTPAPPAAGGFATADVNESQVETIGDVQYISVEAVAQGPASELSDRLSLTSSPPREQGELLALVGSNVFSGVTGASLTQVAGFIGGGSLASFGDRIADAVGLRSFSVFPTTDTADDSSVGIGIGVEATADISSRFGVSIFEILNSSNPPQLGLQYRFTDDLDLRGASNLDETEFKLEYRIEF
ncbi:MAG: translocation/assembly module TamB domain-containing protein, partial [Phormidesmis sp.]